MYFIYNSKNKIRNGCICYNIFLDNKWNFNLFIIKILDNRLCHKKEIGLLHYPLTKKKDLLRVFMINL